MVKRTVLILEDEALIAMDVAMELEAAGLTAVQTHTIADALTALEGHSFDAAILDLDVRGQATIAVAEALRMKRVPFMICSGSQFSDLSEIFSGAPAIPKPFRSEELSATLYEMMDRGNQVPNYFFDVFSANLLYADAEGLPLLTDDHAVGEARRIMGDLVRDGLADDIHSPSTSEFGIVIRTVDRQEIVTLRIHLSIEIAPIAIAH